MRKLSPWKPVWEVTDTSPPWEGSVFTWITQSMAGEGNERRKKENLFPLKGTGAVKTPRVRTPIPVTA